MAITNNLTDTVFSLIFWFVDFVVITYIISNAHVYNFEFIIW